MNKEKENIKQSYQQYVDKYSSEVAVLKRKGTGFVTGELLSFAALLIFVVCYFAVGDGSYWLYLSLAALVVYFIVRHFDDKNRERTEHLSALLKVCQHELKAMEGDFTPFETGAQYQDPQHPYSFDLDVFGKDSLFNRICRTITTGGSDALGEALSREIPLLKGELDKYADLQKDLASDDAWRMEFMALGELSKSSMREDSKIDTEAVATAIQRVSAMTVPAWFGKSFALIGGWMLIVGVFASVVLAYLGFISSNIPLWWVLAQYMVVFFGCKTTLDKIDSCGGKLRHQLVAYSQILHHIAGREFRCPQGKVMQELLADALPSFAELEQILKGYDRRGNFLGLFFTDSFLLSDFFLVRRFLRWKNSYMAKMAQWMDVVSEMDAAVSMADFRRNHPEATDAEVVDDHVTLSGGEPVPVTFEAKNLYHPFLGDKAVKNDFSIQDGNYYIITGANMAGKSTFLRSLGVNYILAMAGMPVFADSLRTSRFQLFSSMRTTDDLTHGISYFNAELLRLEQLLKYCESSKMRTLIILDEILKGTNSLDKLNGSRMFLEAISRQRVSGVIATHDLELSKMEQEHPDRFHNYCFEIDVGTDVTYTYKIQRGVARNQNATFLLNKILERY